jgi:hypothetical protein
VSSSPDKRLTRIWADWNADIEAIELQGPFAEGSLIAMTPAGQETVPLWLAEVSEPELFVDEAVIGGATFRTTHRLEQLDCGRVRVSYRMEITGP